FSNGSQNQLGYIPVRYSDFIMSAWAEEQGFKGVLLALGLYMALLLRLVQNAQRAKDRAGMFLVMGVAAALGFHVLVHVAMVIGATPSAFERPATSLPVLSTCVAALSGGAPVFANSGGHTLAVMLPGSLGQAGAAQKGDSGCAGITHKEFSCRKNWLFPRPPTNGESRFLKKVS